MRPVLLEMNGFASFREPTSVDFTDADYFALVGPTGSGKSTVVDAMTFALYGSAPRWGRRNAISYALAPTANRATVRLVFEVGARRYVVAREVRRTGAQISTREVRLEQLADPAGTGGPDEVSDVLAAEGEVTAHVERLLGLTFEQFCQCVVLPQGKFADFLQATAGDRQEILLQLVGARHYDDIARRANQHAATAAQRVKFLDESLAELADATQEADRQARQREEDVERLVRTVSGQLPGLALARKALDEARADRDRVDAERSTLASITIPADVADVDIALSAAKQALGAAAVVESAAELADTTARERVAAAPARAPLEQARRDHGENARLTADLPATQGAARKADAALASAQTAVSTTEELVESQRERLQVAARRRDEARRDVDVITGHQQILRAVATPAGLADLDSRAQAGRQEVAAARAELAQTEVDDAQARAALAQAPPRAPLEQARRDFADLAALEARLPHLAADHARLQEQQGAAAQAVVTALEQAEAARQARDQVAQRHSAAAMRPLLVLGEPCPVCEASVAVLPKPLEAPALGAADEAVNAAERAVLAARRLEGEAMRAEGVAGADLGAARSQADLLRNTLIGAPDSPADVDRALAGLDALVTAATSADERLGAARARQAQAQERLEAITVQEAAERTRLRAVRDPLVPLGAPDIESSTLLAGWTLLGTWAGEQALARARQLRAATAELEAGEQAVTQATEALAAAQARLRSHRNEQTAAVEAAEKLRSRLAAIRDRLAELTAALADAPSDDQARAVLAHRDELEAAASAADAALRAARRDREACQLRVRELDERVDAAWTVLRHARDSVVALGAPEVKQAGVLDAWIALSGWAGAQSTARTATQPRRDRAVAVAQASHEQAESALCSQMAEHGVHCDKGDLATTALAAVTGAHAEARAEAARIRERLARAQTVLSERGASESEQQVARMLAGLLHSTKFPRWLATAALDTLLVDASATLLQLSGGQFELSYDIRNDLVVVDHADADSQRSVRTLSGGETFQASLALALALSAQMSQLSAAGAARLDSIFLDEGFGTLDPDTLEVVAETLENLAQGERMVGVITHVAALAERIPVRFAVRRDARTSTVHRQGT